MAKAPFRAAWLGDLAAAWIFYSVLPLPPGLTPRFERIARFAPWV
ncbi:MAG: adenosylcobinamide-GDP ribazoletransferase, partial [Synechococcaceae bacterium WB7_3xG_012]|nr:adenosylcobinamide-GDP ribazoletransferase [Synechococcaceae bacterium WB7_3xG_012]